MIFKQFSLFICLAILSSAASAQYLYRYKDETGRTILNSSISGEDALGGYEVLDPTTGQVVDRIAPTILDESSDVIYATPDDEILLSSYSSVEEINERLQRKLEQFDAEVANIESDKRILEAELAASLEERQRLTDREREIPEDLAAQIGELEANLEGLNLSLDARANDRERELIEYNSKAKRFTELKAADEIK